MSITCGVCIDGERPGPLDWVLILLEDENCAACTWWCHRWLVCWVICELWRNPWSWWCCCCCAELTLCVSLSISGICDVELSDGCSLLLLRCEVWVVPPLWGIFNNVLAAVVIASSPNKVGFSGFILKCSKVWISSRI